MNLIQISTTEEFLKFLTNGTSSEKIIFKHSYRCPVSLSAKRNLIIWLNSIFEKDKPLTIIIDVINDKMLSEYISKKYKIVHQSPQIIWLNEKNLVKWHESHYQITEEKLSNQLKTNY
ncbi:MAG: bacillithiol system redox-active protein YtxJ [Bacteroidetes bacterium]|nr:bacillithiol system redox-active protein YtxJ [Bacteroidota bacterium]